MSNHHRPPTYDELMRLSRRHFLGASALGLGGLALGSIAGDAHGTPPVLESPHFPAKAKRVIYLFQSGGPSHLETLDPKPLLRERHTQPLPDSATSATNSLLIIESLRWHIRHQRRAQGSNIYANFHSFCNA